MRLSKLAVREDARREQCEPAKNAPLDADPIEERELWRMIEEAAARSEVLARIARDAKEVNSLS